MNIHIYIIHFLAYGVWIFFENVLPGLNTERPLQMFRKIAEIARSITQSNVTTVQTQSSALHVDEIQSLLSTAANAVTRDMRRRYLSCSLLTDIARGSTAQERQILAVAVAHELACGIKSPLHDEAFKALAAAIRLIVESMPPMARLQYLSIFPSNEL